MAAGGGSLGDAPAAPVKVRLPVPRQAVAPWPCGSGGRFYRELLLHGRSATQCGMAVRTFDEGAGAWSAATPVAIAQLRNGSGDGGFAARVAARMRDAVAQQKGGAAAAG
eukprot:gene16464-36642_t